MKENVIFHHFAQKSPLNEWHVGRVNCAKFLVVDSGVSILYEVKLRPFPLIWGVAVNSFPRCLWPECDGRTDGFAGTISRSGCIACCVVIGQRIWTVCLATCRCSTRNNQLTGWWLVSACRWDSTDGWLENRPCSSTSVSSLHWTRPETTISKIGPDICWST